MHMATEHVLHARSLCGGIQAGGGGALVVDVAPQFRAIGTGMDQQNFVQLDAERQGIQPGKLAGVELGLGPGGGAAAKVLDVSGRVNGHFVMVAFEHYGAVFHEWHEAVQHGAGVGAVAHQITQKGETISALRARVIQTGVQCLNVSMDIGHHCQSHVVSVLL